MIQRKQSLYLLIVTALMAAMLFMPLMKVTMPGVNQTEKLETAPDGTIVKTAVDVDSIYELNVWGLYLDGEQSDPLTYFSILTILVAAVPFITIFLYRKRWIQLRLCFVTGVLLLGMIVYEGMYIYRLHQMVADNTMAAVKYSVTDLFPVLALIFIWLAYRGVVKDIALLRSLDRIR